MSSARFCPNCGTDLPPAAQYCPKCGTATPRPVVAPVPPPVSPPVSPAPVTVRPARSTYFIWVPIAIIALGLLAWAILSGFPFSREPRQPEKRTMVVVDEGTAPTGTVTQIGETASPPPATPRRTVPLTGRETPAPVIVEQRTEPPRRSERPAGGEISESEAVDVLRSYISARRDYDVSSECLSISSSGYRNEGYTLTATDRCGARSLGQWRVDSKTRDVFRRQEDGRFLRP